MRKSQQYVFFVLLAILIPVAGYAAMHLAIYFLGLNQQSSAAAYVFYTVFIIALGLALPYWMLKAGRHAAHLRNRQEGELHLSDIPKDKDELNGARPR